MEKIAAEIFERYGMSLAHAERAGGWTNCVWLNGDTVLRLSNEPGSDRIRREVALGNFLPENVGYPLTLATGVEQGFEWSLTRRLNGTHAHDAWLQLSLDQKKDLLRQVWTIITSLHLQNVEQAAHLVKHQPWYSTFQPDESRAFLGRFARDAVFTASEIDVLEHIIYDFFIVLPGSPVVLNHGDITVENIFWDTDGRVHLLDFEHALIAPPQVDVYSFLRIAFHPPHDDYLKMDAEETDALRKEAVKYAGTKLANRRDAVLLLGCAVLISLRRLEIWWNGAEDKNGFRDWEPYLCLKSFTEQKGGLLHMAVGHLL